MTVFVPISASTAQALRATGASADLVGYADGPGLRQWLGDTRLDDEEADYVALNHAGIAALLLPDGGSRLVLAVDQEPRSADPLGSVAVRGVRWTEVRSLFADDPSAAAMVEATRSAVRGLDLAAALTAPEVDQLQDAHDLLWFAPEELDALAGRA